MKQWFIYLSVFMLLALCCGAVYWYWASSSKLLQSSLKHEHVLEVSKPTVGITVFVHGTVGSSLNIFNFRKCLSDTAKDDTFCVRLIKKYRNHPAMQFDQIMGAEGYNLFESTTCIPYQASCYLIPVYDEIARIFEAACSVEQYVVFGWSGLLSQRARRQAGYQLYNALVEHRDTLRKTYGVEPVIRIVSHSHGGNVALWLAQAEQDLKKGLAIDMLFMYGSPMQVETSSCITSPIFKKIFLGYSYGDFVQRFDTVSTSKRESFMRMADVVNLNDFIAKNPSLVRCDLCFVVNGKEKQVCHTNMWLCGRDVPIFDFMDPLPLMVLTPQIVSAISSECCCTDFRVHICADKGRCWVCLAECLAECTSCKKKRAANRGKKPKKQYPLEGEKVLLERHVGDEEVYRTLATWGRRMNDEWRSFDTSRDVLFNYKNAQAMKAAIFG